MQFKYFSVHLFKILEHQTEKHEFLSTRDHAYSTGKLNVMYCYKVINNYLHIYLVLYFLVHD